MTAIPVSNDEQQRLEALRRYAVLDTPPEEMFDRITRLAASIFDVPIALIILIDRERQWFKSCYGFTGQETPREQAFCTYTILSNNPMVIEDALQDSRFANNPLVTGQPYIRFYAGAPLLTPDGFRLGTLCLIDQQPRQILPSELVQLQELAAIVMDELEFRAKLLEQIQRDLHQSEAKYQTLIEQIPVVTFTALPGEAAKTLFVSPQIETLLGYTSQEWIADPNLWTQRVHPDYREKTTRLVEESANNYTPFQAEYPMIHRDGRVVWVLDKGVMIDDQSGYPFLYQGVLVDITEHKQYEEEHTRAEKLAALGVLAGGLAHDFNNLLAAIQGNLSLIRVGGTAIEVTEYVSEAENGVARARQLAQQFLTFAKGGEPIKRVVTIDGIIQEAVKANLQNTNIRAELQIKPDVWPVEADPNQLGRVIYNIILNALQAMPITKQSELIITARNVTADYMGRVSLPSGNFIEISITDNGNGIQSEILPKIFDPYFTTKNQGNGLGLAVVYSIIKKHGGFVTVTSQPGQGTTFWLYLPAQPNLPKSAHPTEQPGLPQRQRILLMEDEETVRRVTGKMLQKLGYEVELAGEGETVLTLYEAALHSGKPFDLVIMDLMVEQGKMGGQEAMRQLLKLDKKAKVIVSSGYSNSPAMANPVAYGFQATLTKPYGLEELSQMLDKVLGKAQTV